MINSSMTGLQPKYDFRLEWEPDPGLNPACRRRVVPVNGGGVTIFTALQRQLGLKLEPRTESADSACSGGGGTSFRELPHLSDKLVNSTATQP